MVSRFADSSGLIMNGTPPVTEALGVIGISAGPVNKEGALNGALPSSLRFLFSLVLLGEI